MRPHKFSDIDLAFPAHVIEHMPKMEDIPDEFKTMGSKLWNVFMKFFASGFQGSPHFYPASGIEGQEAYRHICCVVRSYEPKHEHKEAAVCYLLSLWFVKIEDDSGVLWERS